jgi:predicted N-acetyltransferase YhbS
VTRKSHDQKKWIPVFHPGVAQANGGFPMTHDVTLHVETRFDVAARERLLDAAFGAERFEKTSERLRAGRLPADGLAFTLKAGGQLVGTLRLWHISAGGVPALLLGPLAVAQSHAGMGLGSKLMHHALAEATWRGHKAVLLVGDAPYYSRFGFDAGLTNTLILPGPVNRARFLGLEFTDGALGEARGLVIATGAAAARPMRRRVQERKAA